MYLLYSTTVTKSRYEEVFVTLGWKLKEEKIGIFLVPQSIYTERRERTTSTWWLPALELFSHLNSLFIYLFIYCLFDCSLDEIFTIELAWNIYYNSLYQIYTWPLTLPLTFHCYTYNSNTVTCVPVVCKPFYGAVINCTKK
jgi:hypothetical protein